MSFLAIDIGNTNITFGILEAGNSVAEARIATKTPRTSDEIRWQLNHFLHDFESSSKIEAAGIASVVFDKTPLVHRAVQDALPEIQCDIVGKTVFPKITITYDPPSAVGVDRLCNVIAGMRRWGTPLIIVDFGTATTIDAVDSEGIYLGGAIAPGIETSLQALALNAAQLYSIALELPPSPIGRNTADAMRSGLLWGALGAVDSLAMKFAMEIGGAPRVVATGGLAPILCPHSLIISEYVPGLVLEGIELICREN